MRDPDLDLDLPLDLDLDLELERDLDLELERDLDPDLDRNLRDLDADAGPSERDSFFKDARYRLRLEAPAPPRFLVRRDPWIFWRGP